MNSGWLRQQLLSVVGLSTTILSLATLILVTKFVWLLLGPSPYMALIQEQDAALALLVAEDTDDASSKLPQRVETVELLMNTTLSLIDLCHRRYLEQAREVRQLEKKYVLAAAKAYSSHSAADTGRNMMALRGQPHLPEIGAATAKAQASKVGYLERFEALAAIEELLGSELSDVMTYDRSAGTQWADRTVSAVGTISEHCHSLKKKLAFEAIDSQFEVIKELWPRNFDSDNAPIYRPLFNEGAAYHPQHSEGLRRWKEWQTKQDSGA
eukprot:GILI01043216.1.p1 GENE.GILI01043216.1~~GILI01043216.1.p1  ORF type:complete len:278 (+),score=42.28 GILI01043216.1:33-836(+)